MLVDYTTIIGTGLTLLGLWYAIKVNRTILYKDRLRALQELRDVFWTEVTRFENWLTSLRRDSDRFVFCDTIAGGPKWHTFSNRNNTFYSTREQKLVEDLRTKMFNVCAWLREQAPDASNAEIEGKKQEFYDLRNKVAKLKQKPIRRKSILFDWVLPIIIVLATLGVALGHWFLERHNRLVSPSTCPSHQANHTSATNSY